MNCILNCILNCIYIILYYVILYKRSFLFILRWLLCRQIEHVRVVEIVIVVLTMHLNMVEIFHQSLLMLLVIKVPLIRRPGLLCSHFVFKSRNETRSDPENDIAERVEWDFRVVVLSQPEVAGQSQH
jgi:hypothetical protein